jgi:hypothetical protein
MMSHTVPGEPAVVLRSNYVHIRALFLVAVAVIVGLTVAVVVLATNNGSSTAGISATGIHSTATSGSAAPIYANAVASEELGAKLDHSGRNISAASKIANAAAIHANAVALEELGAKLDHSGRNIPSS